MQRKDADLMELAYAPRAHAPKRRHVAAIATVIACVALVAVAILWGSRWVTCIRLVYVERQCAAYRASGDTVFSTDSSKSASQVASLPPSCWKGFYSLVSGTGFASDGTAFLHERFTPNGHPRLVAVDVESGSGSISLRCRSYSRTEGLTFSRELSSTNWQGLIGWYNNVKILGGRTDAANPSHFTIDADIDGKHQIIDGWITDADDNVKLQVRAASSTSPVEPSWASTHD
jgi:hypothetical protein